MTQKQDFRLKHEDLKSSSTLTRNRRLPLAPHRKQAPRHFKTFHIKTK